MARSNALSTGATVKVVGNVGRNIAPPLNKINGDALLKIGKAIRRTAKRGIRNRVKGGPHSRAGAYPKTRTGIYRHSIKLVQQPRTKTVEVGPERRTTKPKKDGSRPGQNSTIPSVIEKGGTVVAPRPTFIPWEEAAPKWQNRALRERNRRRGYVGMSPVGPAQMKWVVIPRGTRRVLPRPAMVKAFNAVVKNKNMQKYWRAIGGVVPMRDRTVRKYKRR